MLFTWWCRLLKAKIDIKYATKNLKRYRVPEKDIKDIKAAVAELEQMLEEVEIDKTDF